MPINTDENTYSIDRVENLINQKSNILHNHINQTIKPISIETTKILIDNVDIKSEISANRQKNIDNTNKSISNANNIFSNATKISNNSNKISGFRISQI